MADDRVFNDNRASAMSSFKITTDKTELDVPAIHHFLGTQSTWAIGISLATVQRYLVKAMHQRFFSPLAP